MKKGNKKQVISAKNIICHNNIILLDANGEAIPYDKKNEKAYTDAEFKLMYQQLSKK